MAKGSFRFPLYSGGSAPDPAVYCPANGYPDPDDLTNYNPTLGDWILWGQFKTNSPGSTTFDPEFGISPGAVCAFKIDGVIYEGHTVSLTLDGTTKDVYFYIKAGTIITSVSMQDDHILGVLDIRAIAIGSNAFFRLGNNPGMTAVRFPENMATGTVSNFLINDTGIKSLDLSMIVEFTASLQLYIYSCPDLVSLILPTSFVLGSVMQLYIHSNPNLIGTINLTGFNKFTASTSLILHSNPKIDNILFASSTLSGTIYQLHVYGNSEMTGIDGSLDFRGLQFNATAAYLQLHSNPKIRNYKFASPFVGKLGQFYLYNCAELQGADGELDLSMVNNFTTSAAYQIYSCPKLKKVKLPTSITGAIQSLYFYLCDITGELDLSGLSTTTSSWVYCYSNPNMTSLKMPPTVFTRLRAYSCALTSITWGGAGTTSVNSCNIQLQNNGMSAAVVNKILFDLNTISVAGYTSRSITINGTNAAPDSSSGGIDGLAEKASLQAKGFIVTTN